MTETKIFLPARLRLTPNQPAVCELHSDEDYALFRLTDTEIENIRTASDNQTTQRD